MGKKCVKMNEQNEFKDIPPLSDEAREYMEKSFRPYLIYESVEGAGKTKKFTCTACGKAFKNGSAVKKRTITPEMRALWSAKHKEPYKCPYCGVETTAINSRILNTRNLEEEKCTCIFLKNGRDDVWIRCFIRLRTYEGTKYTYSFQEWMRYRLRPGKAEFWELYNGGWKKGNFREAFTWNFGA